MQLGESVLKEAASTPRLVTAVGLIHELPILHPSISELVDTGPDQRQDGVLLPRHRQPPGPPGHRRGNARRTPGDGHLQPQSPHHVKGGSPSDVGGVRPGIGEPLPITWMGGAVLAPIRDRG